MGRYPSIPNNITVYLSVYHAHIRLITTSSRPKFLSRNNYQVQSKLSHRIWSTTLRNTMYSSYPPYAYAVSKSHSSCPNPAWTPSPLLPWPLENMIAISTLSTASTPSGDIAFPVKLSSRSSVSIVDNF
jgi:hypothetical protein